MSFLRPLSTAQPSSRAAEVWSNEPIRSLILQELNDVLTDGPGPAATELNPSLFRPRQYSNLYLYLTLNHSNFSLLATLMYKSSSPFQMDYELYRFFTGREYHSPSTVDGLESRVGYGNLHEYMRSKEPRTEEECKAHVKRVRFYAYLVREWDVTPLGQHQSRRSCPSELADVDIESFYHTFPNLHTVRLHLRVNSQPDKRNDELHQTDTIALTIKRVFIKYKVKGIWENGRKIGEGNPRLMNPGDSLEEDESVLRWPIYELEIRGGLQNGGDLTWLTDRMFRSRLQFRKVDVKSMILTVNCSNTPVTGQLMVDRVTRLNSVVCFSMLKCLDIGGVFLTWRQAQTIARHTAEMITARMTIAEGFDDLEGGKIRAELRLEHFRLIISNWNRLMKIELEQRPAGVTWTLPLFPTLNMATQTCRDLVSISCPFSVSRPPLEPQLANSPFTPPHLPPLFPTLNELNVYLPPGKEKDISAFPINFELLNYVGVSCKIGVKAWEEDKAGFMVVFEHPVAKEIQSGRDHFRTMKEAAIMQHASISRPGFKQMDFINRLEKTVDSIITLGEDIGRGVIHIGQGVIGVGVENDHQDEHGGGNGIISGEWIQQNDGDDGNANTNEHENENGNGHHGDGGFMFGGADNAFNEYRGFDGVQAGMNGIGNGNGGQMIPFQWHGLAEGADGNGGELRLDGQGGGNAMQGGPFAFNDMNGAGPGNGGGFDGDNGIDGDGNGVGNINEIGNNHHHLIDMHQAMGVVDRDVEAGGQGIWNGNGFGNGNGNGTGNGMYGGQN